MRFLLIVIYLSISSKSYTQILNHYEKIKKQSITKDSIYFIKYYKSIDVEVSAKIDSFIAHLKKIKYEIDTNYFFVLRLYERFNKLNITVSYKSGYCDYLVLTLPNQKDTLNEDPFAFSFYKNRLILFKTTQKRMYISDESNKLISNLIYENVDNNVKREIDFKVNSYIILSKPLKSYILR